MHSSSAALHGSEACAELRRQLATRVVRVEVAKATTVTDNSVSLGELLGDDLSRRTKCTQCGDCTFAGR
jgi:hypothetical protein